MHKRIILFVLLLAVWGLLACSSNDFPNTEEVITESAPSQPKESVLINTYEIPELCMDFKGNIVELNEIRWYVWMVEKEAVDLMQMPHNVTELQEILVNCFAEIIQVPKELLPVYSLYLHATNGASFVGEDELCYYYYTDNISKMRVIAPEENVHGYYKLVRNEYIENGPKKVLQEDCLEAISDSVTPTYTHYLSTISDPRLLYMPLYADDVETDYSGTIKDAEWVKDVQWARKELLEGKYAYPDDVVNSLMNDVEVKEKVLLYETEEYHVLDARAQIYADCRINGQRYGLDEIIVLQGMTEETPNTPQLFVWFYDEGEWTFHVEYSYHPNFYQDITTSLKYLNKQENIK